MARTPITAAFQLGLALLTLAGRHSACAQDTDSYTAPRSPIPITLDGVPDSVWNHAPWDTLAYNYLPGTPFPTASDLFARYKALWDPSALHLLVEVVDDSLSDRTAAPLKNWWNDDCVEIFLDEDRSGGDHQFNFGAWAYHISTSYDVVDYGDDEQPHLFNEHVRVVRSQVGDTSRWEMSIQVHGPDYTLAGPNTPLTLYQGKVMGFSLAYCDNDGRTTRESFVGSVNTPGHLANEGYLDASVFGALRLDALPPTAASRVPASPGMDRRHGAFRLHDPAKVSIRNLRGTLVRQVDSRPADWLGTDLAPGLYAVRAENSRRTRDFLFSKP